MSGLKGVALNPGGSFVPLCVNSAEHGFRGRGEQLVRRAAAQHLNFRQTAAMGRPRPMGFREAEATGGPPRRDRFRSKQRANPPETPCLGPRSVGSTKRQFVFRLTGGLSASNTTCVLQGADSAPSVFLGI